MSYLARLRDVELRFNGPIPQHVKLALRFGSVEAAALMQARGSAAYLRTSAIGFARMALKEKDPAWIARLTLNFHDYRRLHRARVQEIGILLRMVQAEAERSAAA